MGRGFGLMLRYFLMVGVSGSVNLAERSSPTTANDELTTYLSTRPGNTNLYASKIFFPKLLTSALASVAVARIIISTSRARGSFSRSGGFSVLRHARAHSAALRRKETDLSFTESAR